MTSETAREAPVDLQRFLCETFDAADAAVLGFDTAGKLTLVNRGGEALTGYRADELMGTDPFVRLFGEGAERIRGHWLSVASGTSLKMEAALCRNSEKRLMRWHVASSPSSFGDGLAFIAVGFDPTRPHELATRARRSERLAAAGVMAAGLAHEIRNPLNGAGLHLSVLERALSRLANVPQAAFEAIAVLRIETRRLSALVTDFLEVSIPRPLDLAACDVNDVVASALELVRQDAAEDRTGLKLEPFPQPLPAQLDAGRVKQALLNLLVNAVEAAGARGHVIARTRRDSDRAEIEIEDDGPGISDPNAPIFDAFYTTKERGTGLGLSVVQRVVSDHGGEIGYTSRPGCTVFTVRLPLIEARGDRP